MEFLEPYNSGGANCRHYNSCLACLTDTSCGWCTTSGLCQARDGADVCPMTTRKKNGEVVADKVDDDEARALVLSAAQCSRCDDHVFCEACSGDELCEWLPVDARCTRRGRYDDAVRDKGMCPVPCQQ